jgi:hypothetical protein
MTDVVVATTAGTSFRTIRTMAVPVVMIPDDDKIVVMVMMVMITGLDGHRTSTKTTLVITATDRNPVMMMITVIIVTRMTITNRKIGIVKKDNNNKIDDPGLNRLNLPQKMNTAVVKTKDLPTNKRNQASGHLVSMKNHLFLFSMDDPECSGKLNLNSFMTPRPNSTTATERRCIIVTIAMNFIHLWKFRR